MYQIYRYTAPDGRVYIGCTARTLEARADDNGIRYKDATKFWKAIQEFGWENLKVDVLETTEDAAEATRLEDEYIMKYHSLDIRYGFNSSKSGGAKTAETRRKQSETMKQILNDPNSYFRSEERYLKQSRALKIALNKPETRKKMQQSALANRELTHKRMLGRKSLYRRTETGYECRYEFPDKIPEFLAAGWKLGKKPKLI